MSDETAALLEFVQGVSWDKYKDDSDVIDILTKIKKRVDAIEAEGDEPECGRAKLVIVGDGAVGKTCLLITFKTGDFPEEYVPTVFENYTVETEHNKEPFLLQLWDTAGQEDYDRLRPLSYPGTDVILLCFSLVNEGTFESIREKWNPEVNHYLENVPKILVGTKVDLREAKIKDPHLDKFEEISTAEGQALAKEIDAVAYIEASAKTGKNLKELFAAAIKSALEARGEEDEPEPPKPKKRSKKSSRDGEKKERSSKKKKSSSKRSGEDGEEKPKKKKRSRTRVEKESTDGEKKERKKKRTRSKTDGGKDGEKKERKHRSSKKKESSSSKKKSAE